MSLVYSLDEKFHESQSLDHKIYRFNFHWGVDEVLTFLFKESFDKKENNGFLDKYSIDYDFELNELKPNCGWVRKNNGLMPIIILATRDSANYGEMKKKRQFVDFDREVEKLSMKVDVHHFYCDENPSTREVKEVLSEGYSNVKFVF